MQQLPHWIDGKARPAANGALAGRVRSRQRAGVRAGGRRRCRRCRCRRRARPRAAFPAWSSLPNSERARWLEKLADALEARLDDFAHAESRDGGKPFALARDIEIPRAVSNLRFFAHAATQFASESHHGEAGLNYTLRQPLGVVGTISPWNLPLYLFTWKIAPALAAGNTVVAKPSEVTPMTATLLGELAAEIGFPSGVLNIVHGLGPDVGEAIVGHPQVKAVSFTGSTAVGKRIAGIAAPMLKKVSLELGGKNPTLVFADSDWRGAARHHRALGVPELRADLPVRLAHPGRARHLQRIPRCPGRARAGAARRRPDGSGRADGPAGLAGAFRQGRRRHRPRARGRRPRAVRRRRAAIAPAGSSRRP